MWKCGCCLNGIHGKAMFVLRPDEKKLLYCLCPEGKKARKAIRGTISKLRGEYVARDAGNALEW